MIRYNELAMVDLEELKKQYPDEWILVEVLSTDELGQPKEIRLIYHSKDRDDTYAALLGVDDGKCVYHFYNGAIPKEGYAVAF